MPYYIIHFFMLCARVFFFFLPPVLVILANKQAMKPVWEHTLIPPGICVEGTEHLRHPNTGSSHA